MNKHQNKNSAMELLDFIDSLGLQESKKIQLLKKIDEYRLKSEEYYKNLIFSKIREELWMTPDKSLFDN